MSTDSDGFNSFFHCLIFYEEINEAEIEMDFDKVTNMLKKRTTTGIKKQRSSDKYQDDEEENDLFKLYKKKI